VNPFRFERAQTAEGAVALLTESDAERPRYLGGGTNLVDLMRLGVETPDLLVDVARLGHDAVEPTDGGGLRVGAAVRNSDLARDRLLRTRYPLVSQALLSGASPQLRNLATIGGNLLQRTRCAYFTDPSLACNKREPGSGCGARDGEHRNHAILGHSAACIATHPSDLAVALTAAGADVIVEGAGGERRIPMPGLHRLPGDHPQHDTVLDPGDLIVAIELPPLEAARRSSYRKVRDRASFSFAVVSVAAALQLDEDGTIRDVRLALGGVAHAPWRAERAEDELRGGPATAERFSAAADAELSQARPLEQNAFKVPLARNLIVASLADLAGVVA
jgi:xanthine dehydrogenase YagS FAD-binding subunit